MMRITLLGSCKVIASDGTDVTPRARKTRGMIAYLALAPGGSATRERLAGLLWSDRQEEQARGSLRQSVTELRAAFAGADENALRIDRDSIQIRLDAAWVDARELERLAAASLEERRQIMHIYAGDLLADLGSIGGPFEEWLYTDRAFRRETALSCMASVLRERLAAGDIADAEAVARSVLGLEAAHEEAHRTIMEAYARRGDKASALRQFQTCTDTLKRVLDAKPAPATIALYDRIKTDRLEAIGEGAMAPPPIVVPVRADADVVATVAPTESPRAAQLSVAVLPFRNVGGDPGSDYLGEGLADEIADGLSRFKWLSVIASGTTGTARGAEADPRETGRRLGVRYSVEGTVRRGGERVRIAVRLVDCEDAHAVWAESRIVELSDVFEVQDEIVREVVGRLDPKLMQAEIERVRRRPPDNRNAYDCVLRAVPLLYKASAESFEQAGHLLRQAVALDPDYARAHAWLSFWYVICLGEGWGDDRAGMADKADHHARLAVERDPDDAMGLAFAAHVESFLRRRFESAERLYERAVTVNPSFGWAWVLRAMLACYRGRPDTAMEYFARYNQLSPFDFYRYFWETVAVIAFALKGQHQEAIAAAEPVLRDHAQFGAIYVPVISSLGHLGRLDEAGKRIADLLKVRPEFSIANFNATYPMEDPAQFAAYVEGLRLAGVAEK